MKFAFLSILFASVAVAGPSTAPTPPVFAVGVWQCPPANFTLAKSVGINTLYGIPTPATQFPPAQYSAAAQAAGLWQVRPPITTAAAENDPYLLAFNQPDESDSNGIPVSVLQANYAAWKKAKPNIPVFENLNGSYVLQLQGNPRWTQAMYSPFLACCDWSGSDIYSATGYGMTAMVPWLQYPGSASATLNGWTAGKPQCSFIEAANQFVVSVSLQPTAMQSQYEAYHAVLCGSTSICWFTIQLGPVFSFWGCPPETVAAMTETDKALALIGPYIPKTGLKPSALPLGWEYGSGSTAAGTLEIILNQNPYTAVYGGNVIAGSGIFVILVNPAGQANILYSTPLPKDSMQVTQNTADIAALKLQMQNIAKAAGN